MPMPSRKLRADRKSAIISTSAVSSRQRITVDRLNRFSSNNGSASRSSSVNRRKLPVLRLLLPGVLRQVRPSVLYRRISPVSSPVARLKDLLLPEQTVQVAVMVARAL